MEQRGAEGISKFTVKLCSPIQEAEIIEPADTTVLETEMENISMIKRTAKVFKTIGNIENKSRDK